MTNNEKSIIDPRTASVLLEKWKKLLDYESDSVKKITNRHTRLSTAMLLENQHQWCLNEASLTSGDGGVFGNTLQGSPGQGGNLASDFYASGDSRLPKVLIPMVRRTFPEFITNEIVGVQPMAGPVGLAFAMRYRYEADPLAYYKQDGGNTNNGSIPSYRSTSDGKEAGYNYLNTAFTGQQNTDELSANPDFEMLAEDQGSAALLSQFEFSSNMPQMTVSFEKTAVEAGTRKLSAKWSVELEQDIKNMNGIDIDNEMTNTLSYEIQAEIDREMIMRICSIALKGGKGKSYSIWNATTADARWSAERHRDLYNRILVEANRIAVRTRRGMANFIVATPSVCAIFQVLPEFSFNPVQSSVNISATGIAKVGILGGQFQVYRDTRTEGQYQTGDRENRLEYALLGYKGAEFYDTGLVFCPYIPVMIQRTIGPNDMAPRIGLMTRYGVIDHLFGAELYYHLIIVRGLNENFTPGTTAQYL